MVFTASLLGAQHNRDSIKKKIESFDVCVTEYLGLLVAKGSRRPSLVKDFLMESKFTCISGNERITCSSHKNKITR